MDPKLIQKFGWLEKTTTLFESPAVNEGDRFYGYYYNEPKVGESFRFFIMSENNRARIIPSPFSTSKIASIEDEFTFRTRNSVYKLISKEQMRDITIDSIINEKDT